MNLLDKDGRGFTVIRIISIVLIVVGVLGLSGIMVYSSQMKNVVISDNGIKKHIKTTKKTVKEVLDQANIKLHDKDSLTHLLTSVVADGSEITIKRATPVTLVADGKEKVIYTNKDTVKEVLDENGVVLNEKDKLNIDPTQKVLQNLVMKITRVKEDIITVREPIGFKVVERYSTTVSRGAKRVSRGGREGITEKVYKVTYEDNNIVNRELVNENLVSKPVDQVVQVGVGYSSYVSRGGEQGDFSSSKTLVMNASAYTAGYESTRKRPGDRGYGRTATGMVARHGVVAVDPRVIPLGTKLYIEGYGYAIAADRGSAIVGNRIDLFFENLSDAIGFGRRNVTVHVLDN